MDASTVETWLPMIDGDGQFEISDLGRVRTIGGKLRSMGTSSCGYSRLHRKRNGRTVATMLHRLVWRTFRGEIPKGLELNHKDGNKKNNALSNLELLTHRENMLHAYATGLYRNYKQPKRKLTAEQVREIRAAKPYPRYRCDLARKYGVVPNTITAILNRQSWRDEP